MPDLAAARLQMALSLGFHIVFAAIGMAMPFLMATAHGLWLRGGDPHYKALTKAWSKGVAIFFAIGAVSGTALSFELGLLWPRFMEHAGPIIGMPFSWEGTAFFLEAVALGLFLYGWERLPRWVHWGVGAGVGIAGVLSAAFVICANAWMNAPAGFTWLGDHATDIDPVAAMLNARSLDLGVHMILAGFAATGFAVAGVHAAQLLRHPRHPLHRRALPIALSFASVAGVLMPLSGDFTAKTVGRRQPEKLAAAEALFTTQRCAPLTLGGLPDAAARRVAFGIEIPCLLSVLAGGSPQTEVQGLTAFPENTWPPVPVVHLAFDVMVGVGTALAAASAAALYALWRRRELLTGRPVLALLTVLTPAGFLALESGWVVTEVGRQPWIVYGVMRTAEALTPMPGVAYTLAVYALLYAGLACMAAWLLWRHVRVVNDAYTEGLSHG